MSGVFALGGSPFPWTMVLVFFTPMHPSRSLTLFFLATTLGSIRAAEPAPEPAELGVLRRDFEKRKTDALRPVLSWYESELNRLERSFAVRSNLDAALAVRTERERQGPGGASELKEMIADTQWQWNGSPPVPIIFRSNGILECDAWNRAGYVLKWKVTAPNIVTYTVLKGPVDAGKEIKLTFAPDFKTFHGRNADGSPIHPSPRIK